MHLTQWFCKKKFFKRQNPEGLQSRPLRPQSTSECHWTNWKVDDVFCRQVHFPGEIQAVIFFELFTRLFNQSDPKNRTQKSFPIKEKLLISSLQNNSLLSFSLPVTSYETAPNSLQFTNCSRSLLHIMNTSYAFQNVF